MINIKNQIFNFMKNNKKLYESIMTSVAKEVKKAINEEYRNDYSTTRDEYEEEGLDVQSDTERWIEAIRQFLEYHRDSEQTLDLYVTLLPAYNDVDIYEATHLAEILMLAVLKDGGFKVPPFDEVFIDSIASEIVHGSLVHTFIETVNTLHTLDVHDFD